MLSTIRRYLRYTSWPILAAMAMLMGVGVMAIRAAEQSDNTLSGFSGKQVIFCGVAAGAFLVTTVIPYQKIGRAAYALFGGTLALLVLVFFLPPIRGSHRWIDLGAFQLQPSELAKVTYVLMLAWYLRDTDNYRRLRGLVVPFLLTFVPMGLIFKEPDLGTSLLFLPTLYFMLYMAGARLSHLLGIIAVATVLILLPLPHTLPETMGSSERQAREALAYTSWEGEEGQTWLVSAAPLTKMKYHQITRIYGWLRQDSPGVIQDEGYQLHQSKMVLGSGKLLGRGDWHEADEYFQMLPDDHTDFIYSVIGGQWGFVGCVGVLLLYGVIFVMGVEIAVITHDAFGRLLAVGMLALLFTQIIINVGMTMGLMPITGMTLPLISYGGSSLLANSVALGLLVNVGLRRPILLSPRPFEYQQKREKPPQPFGPLGDDPRPVHKPRDESAKAHSPQ